MYKPRSSLQQHDKQVYSSEKEKSRDREFVERQLPFLSQKLPVINSRNQPFLNIKKRKYHLDSIKQSIYRKCKFEDYQYRIHQRNSTQIPTPIKQIDQKTKQRLAKQAKDLLSLRLNMFGIQHMGRIDGIGAVYEKNQEEIKQLKDKEDQEWVAKVIKFRKQEQLKKERKRKRKRQQKQKNKQITKIDNQGEIDSDYILENHAQQSQIGKGNVKQRKIDKQSEIGSDYILNKETTQKSQIGKGNVRQRKIDKQSEIGSDYILDDHTQKSQIGKGNARQRKIDNQSEIGSDYILNKETTQKSKIRKGSVKGSIKQRNIDSQSEIGSDYILNKQPKQKSKIGKGSIKGSIKQRNVDSQSEIASDDILNKQPKQKSQIQKSSVKEQNLTSQMVASYSSSFYSKDSQY